MSFFARITPVVLTYNEAPNIARTLARLSWATEVVVVDSGSYDGTQNIVAGFPNTRLVHHRFDSHAQQWNFAVHKTAISTDWVLALDADFELTYELINELGALEPPSAVDGYRTRFLYCVHGKPLRGTLYPPVITLFRKERGIYEQDGHTQRLRLPTKPVTLVGRIRHDDRKPLARWLWAQDRYATLEVSLLRSKSTRELRLQDQLRKLMVVTPWLVPLYCLTVGRGLLDGWAGVFYALQRGVAEAVLSLKLLEELVGSASPEPDRSADQ